MTSVQDCLLHLQGMAHCLIAVYIIAIAFVTVSSTKCCQQLEEVFTS